MDSIERVSLFQDKKIATPVKGHPALPAREIGKTDDDYNEKMDQIQSAIQSHLGITDFKLNFSVDKETKTVVVKILDSKTGEVIQEIPPPEILALAKEMEELKGILFNKNI